MYTQGNPTICSIQLNNIITKYLICTSYNELLSIIIKVINLDYSRVNRRKIKTTQI